MSKSASQSSQTLPKLEIAVVQNTRFPAEKAPTIFIAYMAEAFANSECEIEFVIPRRVQTNKALQNISAEEYYGFDKIPFSLVKLFTINERFVFPRRMGFIVQTLSFSVSLFIYALMHNVKYYYTHDIKTLPLFRLLKHIKRDLFVIYEHHYEPSDKVHYFCVKHGFSTVDLFVCQTKFLKDNLTKKLELQSQDYSAVVLPMGFRKKDFLEVNNRAFLKKSLGIDHKYLIGYTGSFFSNEGEKGIRTVIETLELLRKKGLKVYLCLLGGEKVMKKPYLKLALKCGVETQIIFKDPIPPNQVPTYLRAFDLCLLPFPDRPHYRHNMSPIKMFEYMASGTPIVSTDLPSVRETLDESTCVFVKPGSPVSMAKGIEKILKNPKHARNIAHEAIRHSSKYSWDNRAKNILSTIRKIKSLT